MKYPSFVDGDGKLWQRSGAGRRWDLAYSVGQNCDWWHGRGSGWSATRTAGRAAQVGCTPWSRRSSRRSGSSLAARWIDLRAPGASRISITGRPEACRFSFITPGAQIGQPERNTVSIEPESGPQAVPISILLLMISRRRCPGPAQGYLCRLRPPTGSPTAGRWVRPSTGCGPARRARPPPAEADTPMGSPACA